MYKFTQLDGQGPFLGSLILNLQNLNQKLSMLEILSPAVFNYITAPGFIAVGATLESLAVSFIIQNLSDFLVHYHIGGTL